MMTTDITQSETLIGPAARYLSVFESKIKRGLSSPLRVLFYGPAGTGKTTAALALAHLAAGSEYAIEHVNGREVTIDAVREWIDTMATGCLFGDTTVKLIDELDLCTTPAQDLLLTYLDRMKANHVVIATSNLDLDNLTPRFQSRFQQARIDPPEHDDVVRLLRTQARSKLTAASIESIVTGATISGHVDVRAAITDIETCLDLAAAV